MGKQSSGKIWPIAISIAIAMVFCFGVTTIIVTSKADLQVSDAYMTYYQDVDANANDLINARIKFDKKYKIVYINNGIGVGKTLSYKVTDLNGKPVDNAKIILAVSRPETEQFNQKFDAPKVKDGVYTFSGIKFSKDGLWDLMAKVSVGDNSRFYNVKADTRTKKIKLY